jgi:flagellin
VSLKLDHVSMTAGGRLAGRIAGLDQGRANAGTAMSLLKVADAGLDEIDAKLARMKELAAQAASVKLTSTDPTPADTSAVERAILNEEFAQLSGEIDAIADTTTFNDLQILNGVSGSGAFSAAFNVGGDSQAEDVITVSIEAATIANLASGLAAADLLSVSGASAALDDVNTAIGKLDETQAGVRGLNVRLYAAASGAAERASEAEAEKEDRLAIRVGVESSRLVAERVLDERDVSALAHDTEMIRDLLATLELPDVRGPAEDDSGSTVADSASRAKGNGRATDSFASSSASSLAPVDLGSQSGSRVDLEA